MPVKLTECLFPFSFQQDIALLHLANVLHRSHHSEDALVALRIALSISPSSSELHLATGNVLAVSDRRKGLVTHCMSLSLSLPPSLPSFLQHLRMLNESVLAYERALQLNPRSSYARSLLLATTCELQLHMATHAHSRKMFSTRKKLDKFYEYMAELHYHQISNSPEVLNYWNDHLLDHGADKRDSLRLRGAKRGERKDEKEKEEVEQKKKGMFKGTKYIPARQVTGFDADQIQDILSDVAADITSMDNSAPPLVDDTGQSRQKGELELEAALDKALAEMASRKEEKSKRVVDKEEGEKEEEEPLEEKHPRDRLTSTDQTRKLLEFPSSPSPTPSPLPTLPHTCVRLPYWHSDSTCQVGEPPQSPPVITLTGLPADAIIDPSKQPLDPSLKRKLSLLHSRKQAKAKKKKAKEDGRNSGEDASKSNKYTEAYRQMEFLPFYSLPASLEEVIFPDRSNPPAEYDDPFWPTKLQCLQLVESAGNLPKFTGTFLTPEARGVRYGNLAIDNMLVV